MTKKPKSRIGSVKRTDLPLNPPFQKARETKAEGQSTAKGKPSEETVLVLRKEREDAQHKYGGARTKEHESEFSRDREHYKARAHSAAIDCIGRGERI